MLALITASCTLVLGLLLVYFVQPTSEYWQLVRHKLGGAPHTLDTKMMIFACGVIVYFFSAHLFFSELQTTGLLWGWIETSALIFGGLLMIVFFFRHTKSSYQMDWPSLSAAWVNWKLTLLDLIPFWLVIVISVGILALLT